MKSEKPLQDLLALRNEVQFLLIFLLLLILHIYILITNRIFSFLSLKYLFIKKNRQKSKNRDKSKIIITTLFTTYLLLFVAYLDSFFLSETY